MARAFELKWYSTLINSVKPKSPRQRSGYDSKSHRYEVIFDDDKFDTARLTVLTDRDILRYQHFGSDFTRITAHDKRKCL